MAKKRYASRRKFVPCPVPRPEGQPRRVEYEYPHKLHGRSMRVACSRRAAAGRFWVGVLIGYALAGLGAVAWCVWYMMR